MKLKQLAIAGTAALSLGALTTAAHAGGDKQAQRGVDQSQAQFGSQQGQMQAQAGHSSDVVKQVQQKLSAEGHNVGPADGILGPQTKEGIKAFQQSKGLQATGQLDQRTLAALGIEGGSAMGGTAGIGGTGATGGTGAMSGAEQRPGNAQGRTGDQSPSSSSNPRY
jgi:peptidoglycan hydrolase-like protein with peptidoglycan-binding domain